MLLHEIGGFVIKQFLQELQFFFFLYAFLKYFIYDVLNIQPETLTVL